MTQSEYNKQYYLKNKERLLAKRKRLGPKYGQSSREYHRKYFNKRMKEDINFRLAHNLRARLRRALKNNSKISSVIKDLGCTLDELKQYLESKFQSGMTWDNYGKWHIDHIIPLSSFDLNNPELFTKACHYLNLQPMWAKENQSKSNKKLAL